MIHSLASIDLYSQYSRYLDPHDQKCQKLHCFCLYDAVQKHAKKETSFSSQILFSDSLKPVVNATL